MAAKLPPFFLHDRNGQTLPTRDIGRGLEVQHKSWAIVTAARELAIGRQTERTVTRNPDNNRPSKSPALVWLTVEEYAQAVLHGRAYRDRMDRARLALEAERDAAARAEDCGPPTPAEPAQAQRLPQAVLSAEEVRAIVREEVSAAVLRVLTAAFNEPMQPAPTPPGKDERAIVVTYLQTVARLARNHANHPSTEVETRDWREGYASALGIAAHEIERGLHEDYVGSAPAPA